ncbi:hypothetical protein NBRC116590_08420 [Pelagimonas sp. KU-00592-HH]|jgi:hypothetical protein|nr:hypothetical protein [Shimia sp. CNT1-13L.2]
MCVSQNLRMGLLVLAIMAGLAAERHMQEIVADLDAVVVVRVG